MPKWTNAQQDTIDSRNENILVSAAAGSGKTAVLVERIKQLVIKDHVDIDKFLITTFTNAAAAEMKQRLENTIYSELENGAEGERRNFLRRQLTLLPAASISTFHSFSLDIIRSYFYLTDLEPGFQIGDDVQVKIMKGEAVSRVFERRFEEDYEAFASFLSRHSSDRHDRGLKDNVISTLNSLKSIPHYMEWADGKLELLGSQHPVTALGLDKKIMEETIKAFESAADLYHQVVGDLEAAGLMNLAQSMYNDLNAIEAVMDSPDFNTAFDFFANYKFERFAKAKDDDKETFESVKEDIKAVREKAKNLLKKVGEKYFVHSLDEYEDDLKKCYADTAYYVDILKETDQVLKNMKQEDGIIDFDDAMHYVISILEDDQVAEELKEKYDYIFIDEYQDSNALQETIIGRIARDNNLFMVGDVKQSIYKFRLAEPEIFMETARVYDRPEEELSRVINLNDNFRSKGTVTDAVNRVFEPIMAGYDDNAALHCNISEDPGHETAIHIIDTDAMGIKSAEKNEMEAALVSRLIKKYLGTSFYDNKLGDYRDITLSDIAVLSRNTRAVGVVEHYLNNEGIPAYGETGDGYFESVEIQAFINILKIIDNLRQDIPLISVMRTVLFDFSIEELSKIRVFRKRSPFYQAVLDYSQDGSDQTIRDKVSFMLNQISIWKEMARTVPLDELIKILLYDTGYYDYCSGLPAGSQRTANLRLIVEKAVKFEEYNHTGLYGFLGYIDAMKDSKVSESEAKVVSEGADVVRIMTVHKSKGLEFPIVILVGAGREISPSQRQKIYIHKDYGIGLMLVNKEEKWTRKTLLQRIIAKTMEDEDRDEEVRILYVAMTRAMDRLEIIGSVKNEEKLAIEPEATSYLNMIYPTLRTCSDIQMTIYSDEDSIQLGAGAASNSFARLMGLASDAEVSEQMRQRLDFTYPHEMTNVRTKYSVSELNRGQREVATYIEDLETSLAKASRSGLTAAEAGTAMHLVMEKIDFLKASQEGVSYVKAFADELLENETISEEERAAIKEYNIVKFFENPVGQRAARAYGEGRLHREQEFIYEKEIDGVPAVVQGIIDCYFVEDGSIVLVDYKNSYTAGGRNIDEIKASYGAQLELYKEALEGATGLKVSEAYLYLFEDSFHRI